MADQLFTDTERLTTAVALLAEIRDTGKSSSKRGKAIAIAHGHVYDPHVDGRLRLTPIGRERVAEQTLL